MGEIMRALADNGRVARPGKIYILCKIYLCLLLFSTPFSQTEAQSPKLVTEDITFTSKGVRLAGTMSQPKNPTAALVIVHGSDSVPRMTTFAKRLAKDGFSVFTYDKRGVGASGGVYVGPEVGTNNVDPSNLNLLAEDASAAVGVLRKHNENIPIGLVGFSQAGWIIPIAANKNPSVDFMVFFSCPVITTLEQLRFQFYTDGDTNFWDSHTEADAREHVRHDPDRYKFEGTDPKVSLGKLFIPGLWVFGNRDIQIPVGLCIEQLNALKANGKPFEYTLFSELGHNTAFAKNTEPVDISIEWIKQKAGDIRLSGGRKR